VGAPLADLIPSFTASVNPPGRTVIDLLTDEAAQRLANAFWSTWLGGFHQDFHLVVPDDAQIGDYTGATIEPNEAGGDELSRSLQQVIVIAAAVDSIELYLGFTAHNRRDKAGPVESETQRHATVLLAVLKARRGELADLRDTLGSGARPARYVAVVDALAARTNDIINGCSGWTR
jgi:hypothetical protein